MLFGLFGRGVVTCGVVRCVLSLCAFWLCVVRCVLIVDLCGARCCVFLSVLWLFSVTYRIVDCCCSLVSLGVGCCWLFLVVCCWLFVVC